MLKSQGGKFSPVYRTSKDKRNQKTPLHTGNPAPRKLLKYYLTAYYGSYCQEEKFPAFSSLWWQLRIIFNLITDSSVDLKKFETKVND